MRDTGLSAEAVSFRYAGRTAQRNDDFALREVTAHIGRGDLVGILGPNGSGKTTVLRLFGGLLRPMAGRIGLDGVDLQMLRRPELARRMAFVPQETQLAFDYTVLEMATMGRYPHLGAFEIEGPDDLDIARESLRATGTLHLASRLFNTLSGGEKQRVVIAGALAQSPEILLLDEPTASLDLAYQLEIRSILERLNVERGITILVSTHDLNLAAALCRDLILLHRGSVLASGPTREMLDPSLIRRLYGVDVDVAINQKSGQLTVVPVSRIGSLPSA